MKSLLMSLVAIGGVALFAGCGSSSGGSSSTPTCQAGMVASGSTCVYSSQYGQYGQYGQQGYGAQKCAQYGLIYQQGSCFTQAGQYVGYVGY